MLDLYNLRHTKEKPMEIKTFRDLIAWQKAVALAKAIYQVTTQIPNTEQFGLTAQMRRAAVSIPSNIAEGHGRQSLTEYIRFLKVARGSLMELQTQLILATELQFIEIPPNVEALQAETDRVLQGLIRSLRSHPK
jgi:four helix bundle protein